MRTICCLNLKGGSGKTTIAINLAACFMPQKKAILVDLDPQRSATLWAKQAKPPHDYVVPMLLDSKSASVRNFRSNVERLVSSLKGDILILDTPPQLATAALFAALVSDIILIPTTASPLDIWATQSAIKTGREAQRERDGKLPRIILVPSRIQPKTVMGRDIRDTLLSMGEDVGPPITQRVVLVESAVIGETIDKYAPGSASHLEFQALVAYISKRMRRR